MKKTFMATIQVEIPRVPNFLMFKDIDGKISIADVPDEQLSDLAEAWHERLLERAAELRALKDEDTP